MKRLLLFFLILFGYISAIAQSTGTEKVYRNEAGIDATTFIKNIFDFGGHGLATYYPPYLFNYRRFSGHTSFRILLGGNFYLDNFPSPFQTGPESFKETSIYFTTKVGYEFILSPGKRWDVYFGPVVNFSYLSEINEANYFNAGYAQGTKNKSLKYGLGPLIGFRFKLNDRLTLTTEGDLLFLANQVRSETTLIPVNPTLPQPTVDAPTKREIYLTEFSPPLSLFINFKF